MPSWLSVLAARLTAPFRRRRFDAEFSEELRAHEDLLADEHVARGLPPAEARRRARLALGNPSSLAQEHREHHTWTTIEGAIGDGRFAIRQLWRRPGFTLAAAFTIALGIGVNTAVFSALDAVALRPLPIDRASRAVRVERWFESQARGNVQFTYSYAEFRYLEARLDALSDLVAVSVPIEVGTQPAGQNASGETPFVAQLTSETFFADLGVHAARGRLPTPDEWRTPGSAPVIFLSDAGWRARFNADPSIAGTTITLNGARFTIAGVAPPSFIGIGNPPEAPDFWAPIGLKVALTSGVSWTVDPATSPLQLIGHLAPSAGLAAASQRTSQLVPKLSKEFPSADATVSLTLEPATFFAETNDPRFTLFVAVMGVLIGVILLAACANLANMLLALAAGRTREIAMRLALGASRARVIRQLLIESVLLSWLGAGIALVASSWSSRLLWVRIADAAQSIVGSRGGLAIDLSPDWRVFLFTSAIATIAGVIFGLAPARQLSNTDIVTHVKDGSAAVHGPRKSRLRSALVAGQVAVSMTLAVTAGLLARGAERGESAAASFDARHMYYVSFASDPDPARAAANQQAVVSQLQDEPAIASVTIARRIPFTGTTTRPFYTDGPAGTTSSAVSLLNTVSSSYFGTFGIPLVSGRLFTADETATGAPVAIVSEGAARALWPRHDPIGQRVRFPRLFRPGTPLETLTVIGVVADARTVNISRIDPAVIYTPTTRQEEYAVLVRSLRDAPVVLAAVRSAVRAANPQLERTARVGDLESRFVRLQRVLPATIDAFALALAALALALAIAGVYGVVSFLASQRTSEMAVRMSLGATRSHIVGLVIGRGLAPVAAGMTAGLVCASALSAGLKAILASPGSPDLLYGLSPFDPVAFVSVILIVAGASLAAAAAPAWRAARVDPIVALKRP